MGGIIDVVNNINGEVGVILNGCGHLRAIDQLSSIIDDEDIVNNLMDYCYNRIVESANTIVIIVDNKRKK